MRHHKFINLALLLSLVVAGFAAETTPKEIAVKGYVLDSACAFTKELKKPISAECATACAKAGSPLVILSDDGTVYLPIADNTPASGQNGTKMEKCMSPAYCITAFRDEIAA